MKALHVVGGLHPSSGGPAYTVPRLCRALNDAGLNTEIFTLAEKGVIKREGVTFFLQSADLIPVLQQLKLSLAMQKALRQEAAFADVIHSHGLWIAPNIYAGNSANLAGKPLVVSPRGMLSPAALQFSQLKKRLIWEASLKAAYHKAAAWHATSAVEAEDIRAFGVKAPIAVIPNGVDLPATIASHNPAKDLRKILFMSRIHPKKGLPTLLEAWGRLAADRPGWELCIVGPDERGHRATLEALVQGAHIPRVTFSGPAYGSAKTALFSEADIFVLPTISENFGIAVAEALAAGIPTIVTKGAPWQDLDERRCGWWIEQGVAPLCEALRAATALPAEVRQEMGERGRTWMQHSFGWEAVANQIMTLYTWLSARGDRPDFIV